jgi:hypothetical protein
VRPAVVAAAAGLAVGAPTVDFAHLPGLQTSAPPWGSGSSTLQKRLPYVHLDALPQEQLAFHVHQHLDLWLNGRKVAVPAAIGIGAGQFQPFITELHTHDATGIVHIEAAQKHVYSLGQLFGEWGVRLSPRCLGSFCGQLRWWVNGKRQRGDPAAHQLFPAHQEIAIALGRPPARVPSGYTFPPGY